MSTVIAYVDKLSGMIRQLEEENEKLRNALSEISVIATRNKPAGELIEPIIAIAYTVLKEAT